MITEKGKKYFVSDWNECDCHLSTAMYNALLRWTSEFAAKAIGVVDRNYDTGLVDVATIYDDVDDDIICKMENALKKLFKEEYKKLFNKEYKKEFRTKIYRYDDLNKYGYSDRDIEYCFFWNNIFKKQVA